MIVSKQIVSFVGASRSSLVLLAAVALLSLGLTPASATTRTEKTFGKWVVACVDSDAGVRSCQLTQQVAAAGGRGASLIMTIAGPKDKQNLVLVVPTGVSLKDGVTLAIGTGAAPLAFAYSMCGPRLCLSSSPLDPKLLAALKASPKGLANYVMANKKLVQVNIDLATFGDAYTYLLSQTP